MCDDNDAWRLSPAAHEPHRRSEMGAGGLGWGRREEEVRVSDTKGAPKALAGIACEASHPA